MKSNEEVATRVIVASLLDDFYPHSIRSELLSRESFRSRYGFEVDFQISFGDSGVSVSRASLFRSIRNMLNNPAENPEIKDKDGNIWTVSIDDASVGKVKLSGNNRSLLLPEFWMLSDDAEIRLANFKRTATELNLPAAACSYWINRLETKPLKDDEVDDLLDDIKETPIHVIQRITSEVEDGNSSYASLVPRSKRYFQRLAGECERKENLKDFIQNSLRGHIAKLVEWRAAEGIKLALLLSAHSLIPHEIYTDQVSSADLQAVFDELSRNGDMVSQLGAIELGLSIVDRHPQLESAIIGMIEKIRDDEPASTNSRFRLLSALVILVEGEVSRAKLLVGHPPFWRRLASIAQASLIERCICSFPINIESFTEWAHSGRGQQFYLQTLCDLRLEPKWVPDFISPEQLKAEFVGRIMNAAQLHKDKLGSQKIRDLTLEDGTGSIKRQLLYPMPFLPGPLEGKTTSEIKMPQDLANSIDEALSQETIDGKSFVSLINSALIFRLDDRFAEQAILALKRAKHYLKQGEETGSFFHLLSGLASVAAVTRSSELANELKILVRRSRAVGQLDFSVDDLFPIGMIAAASNEELKDWCEYVGGWTTELAYADMSEKEASRLLAHVRCLCGIVPELWTTLGRAEAALASIAR